jgi:hypothetical protein
MKKQITMMYKGYFLKVIGFADTMPYRCKIKSIGDFMNYRILLFSLLSALLMFASCEVTPPVAPFAQEDVTVSIEIEPANLQASGSTVYVAFIGVSNPDGDYDPIYDNADFRVNGIPVPNSDEGFFFTSALNFGPTDTVTVTGTHPNGFFDDFSYSIPIPPSPPGHTVSPVLPASGTPITTSSARDVAITGGIPSGYRWYVKVSRYTTSDRSSISYPTYGALLGYTTTWTYDTNQLNLDSGDPAPYLEFESVLFDTEEMTQFDQYSDIYVFGMNADVTTNLP